MIQTIITAAICISQLQSTYLLFCLFFFARAQTKEYRNIYIGQYVGSVTLIVVSLFFAFVLNYVPENGF